MTEPQHEICRNPWKKDCKNADIATDILYEGQTLPICRKCWDEVGDSSRQWSSDGKLGGKTQLSEEQRKAISDRMKLYRSQHPELKETLQASLKKWRENKKEKVEETV